MAESGLKLLGAWPSPYALRARIALNIKSVDYEFIEETSLESKSEFLLKSNPVYKRIPVLIHGDKQPICESLIIVEYIDEVWSSSGRSILPADPHDRAAARFWAAYLDDKWFPSLRALAIVDGDARKAVLAQLEEGLLLLEGEFGRCSKGGAFFGGNEIGFLDIAFGCFLGWVWVVEKFNGIKLLDEAKFPALFKWSESFASDPAVKGLIPETEKLAEFAAVLIAKMRGAPPPS